MKKNTLIIILFLATTFHPGVAAPTSKNQHPDRPPHIHTITPPKPGIQITIQPMEARDLPDIEDRALDLDIDTGEDGIIPADDLYTIWDNLKVNPYKIPPDSILTSDTIHLDLTGFKYPLTKHYKVTSEYGPRRRRFHHGIDLKVYKGDSILSVMNGMVRIAKRIGSYGNLVVIRHNNGLESFYGHLSKINVKQDQTVKAGDLIGHGGSTGRSTGTHLHFELRYLGQCLNPRDLVDFDSLCTKNKTIHLTQNNFDHRKTAPPTYATSGRTWTVRKGDCLSNIARRTKTTVAHLCYLNKITTRTIIHPGKKIIY
jgi:LysM repeat protein